MSMDFSDIEDRPIMPDGEAVNVDDGDPIIPAEGKGKPAPKATPKEAPLKGGEGAKGSEEPEETEEADEAEEPEEADESEDEAPPPVELSDPEAKVKIAGKEYTVKDVQDQLLMRADYTRKTQVLAEQTKEYQASIASGEEREIEVSDFVERMKSPREVINEFSHAHPEVWERVQQQIIERFSGMADMSEGELLQFLKNEKHELAQWAAGRNAKVQGLINDKRAARTQQGEFRKAFETDRETVMTAAGLDPDSADHVDLVMDAMTGTRNKGKRWSKALLEAEVKRIADRIKPTKKVAAKAPPAADPPPAKEAPTPEPPKTPPLRAPGVRKKASGASHKQGKESLSGFFEKLRNG